MKKHNLSGKSRMPRTLPRFLRRAALIAAALTFALPAWADEYQLGTMDRLRIRVAEWQTAEGAVRDWSVVSGEYTVGPSGALSLPFIGDLPAAGKTTTEVGEAIGEKMQTLFGLRDRPSASVELAQYRPVYLAGEVQKPGEYPFVPNLTVLKAVSLGGGLRRSESGQRFARDYINAHGDSSVQTSERNRLLIRRARLQAEIAEKEGIELPKDLQGVPGIDKLLANETALMASRDRKQKLQLKALADLKSLLESEIQSLAKKTETQNRQLELVVEVGGLEAVLDGGDEAACVCTIDDLVVVGEWQVAHLADGDGVLAVLVDNDRALFDSRGAQDAGLWRNQDRGIEHGALGTDVGHGEGSTGQIVRLQLVIAGLISQLRNLLRDLRQGHVLCLVDDRGEQTLRSINSDSDVDVRVVGHLLGLWVVGRIDVRVGDQSLGGSLHDEWQEGQVGTVLVDECLLVLLAHIPDRSHVDFLHVGQLGGGLQRLDHLGGRDLADAVDLLGGADKLLLRRIHSLGGPASARAGSLLLLSGGGSAGGGQGRAEQDGDGEGGPARRRRRRGGRGGHRGRCAVGVVPGGELRHPDGVA